MALGQLQNAAGGMIIVALVGARSVWGEHERHFERARVRQVGRDVCRTKME